MRNALLNGLLLCLGLPLACFGQALPQPSSGDPIAVVAGQPIFESDLEAALGPQQMMQLRNQEYEVKGRMLENLIRLRLVEAEAKRLGIPGETLLEREADSKVVDPTDGEVEAYLLGQGRSGARMEDVKEQYRTALKRLRVQKARQVYADSLRAKTAVVIHLRPPSVQVTHDPARVKGDPKAPVIIVEFSDFQCPYCKTAQTTLKNILTKYNGRVKLAYRDFPLREIHPQAQTAAEAARCAGEQGKFWEFHDALFADQSNQKEADLAAHARTLGLDEKSFQSCLGSGKYTPKVEEDLQDGSRVGITGTPGFFINGVFLRILGLESNCDRFMAAVETVEASRRYKLRVTTKPDAPLGCSQEPLYLITDHPTRSRLRVLVNVLIKSDVYVNPETVDFGQVEMAEISGSPGLLNLLGQTFLVKTRQGEISLTSVGSDLDFLEIRQFAPEGKSATFRIDVGLKHARLRPGPISGSIHVATSDPRFPELTVPVRGEIR